MRKFAMFTAAAATFAVAAPASAQVYGQVYAAPSYGYVQPYGAQPYGYAQPYGAQPYGAAYAPNWLYNFRDNRYASMMQDRVQRIRSDIRNMAMQRVLSRGEARRLGRQADNLQRRIWRYSHYGVSPYEARAIDRQVRNLEERVVRQASDWNRRSGVRRYNPYQYSNYWNRYGRY